MSQNTATLLRDTLPGWNGHAALYRVDPPVRWHTYTYPDVYGGSRRFSSTTRFVILSSVGGGPWGIHETLIFPATKDGQEKSFTDLSGGQRGTVSHREVLEDAGYDVN